RQAGKSVHVGAHDRAEVEFPVSTARVGTAQFQFGVVADGTEYSDAAEVKVPVLKPATFESFAAYGQIDDGAEEQAVQPPHEAVPDTGSLDVTVSSTAYQALSDSYDYLRTYPFECSEQMSARMISMLSLRDALTAFGALKGTNASEFQHKIELDIKELLTRQKHDGSFGLWTVQDETVWPYVSIQVSRALFLAREKNFPVPDAVINKCKAFLRSVDRFIPADYPACARHTVQAQALYLRYLQHDVDAQTASTIVRESASQDKAHGVRMQDLESASTDVIDESLSVEAAAWLLPVLANSPAHSADFAALKRLLLAHTTETASTASVQTRCSPFVGHLIFFSEQRPDAVFLDSLIQVDAKNDLVPKLARELLTRRQNGHWLNTQENLYCLLAFDRYFSTFEKKTPEFESQVWYGKTFVGSANFAGRSTDSQTISLPISFIEKEGAQNLLINKNGPGRLYYRLGMQYSPTSLQLNSLDRGFAVQRKFEAVDDAGDVSKDAAGVWHIKAGKTARVLITFSCNGRRYHSALVSPLASGTEPINTELSGNRMIYRQDPSKPVEPVLPSEASDLQFAPVTSMPAMDSLPVSAMPPPPLPGSPLPPAIESDMIPSPWWTWSWFEHQNLRDHQAEAFSSVLAAGTYTYSYLVRATARGQYIIPPATLEEMYSPDTFGRTSTDHLVVE
ncbi:MAG TPA: hypothetical protein V6C72_08830, partial [Chroococcales cyanobacterium]